MEALFAGFGRVELTPPLGVELAGYGYYLNRRAASVEDALWARAVCLRQGQAACLIISCDLLGLSSWVAREAREQIARLTGLRDDQIMLVCTHTHTGPAIDWLEGCGERDEAYVRTLPGRIGEAAIKSVEHAMEVTGFSVCEREIKPVGFNRERSDGPNDACVRGAMLYRRAARPIALVSYGCHPVTLGPVSAVSADYPGWVCARMDELGADAVFLNAMCGDIDPESNRVCWGAGTVDTIRGYGHHIADGFMGGLAEVHLPRLMIARRRFALNVRLVDADFARCMAGEVIRRMGAESGEARVARVWLGEMMRRAPTDVEYADVSMASLGPVALATLPYEGFTVIADRARAHLPGRIVAILGCADKTMGYLPAAGEFERSTYAALASALLYMRPPFASGAAEALGDALGDAMAKTLPAE